MNDDVVQNEALILQEAYLKIDRRPAAQDTVRQVKWQSEKLAIGD